MADVFATTPKVTTERRVIKDPPAPLKVTIYAKDGTPLEVFPVDAKEIVAGGEYFYTVPASEVESQAPEPLPEEPTEMTGVAPPEPVRKRRRRSKVEG